MVGILAVPRAAGDQPQPATRTIATSYTSAERRPTGLAAGRAQGRGRVDRGHEGVPTEDGEIWAHGGRVAETDQDVIVADEFEAPNAP